MKSFQESIRQAPSADPTRLAAQQDAYYNLGNSLYRAGQNTQQSAPQDTRRQWQEAIKAYDTALQLRPDDADSRFNRDFVQRKLDELNKPPPPNPQQNPDQKPPPDPTGSPPPKGNSPPPPAPPSGSPAPPGAAPPGRSPPPSGERAPAEMSADEAQQLLDSAKGDERPGLKAPIDSRRPNQPPEKPFKNW